MPSSTTKRWTAIVLPEADRLRAVIGLLSLFLLLSLLVFHQAGVARAGSRSRDQRLILSTFSQVGVGWFFSRVLVEAYTRLGYEVEIRDYPAGRSVVMADQGLVDGEAARVKVVEREFPNLVRVPTPVYVNRIMALTAVNGLDPAQGWGQLHGHRLCIRNGYKYLEVVTQGFECHKVSSYEQMLTLLENGRVDVGLADYLDILPTLSRVPLVRVRMLDTPIAANPMYHYLNRRHAALVPRVDAVLREMTEEGWIEEAFRELAVELYEGAISPCPVPLDN